MSLLGDINAYLSIFVIIGPIFFKLMGKFWSGVAIFRIGAIAFGLSLAISLLFQTPFSLIFTLIPIGLFMSIGLAYPAILISCRASQKKQGAALGTNIAIQVFAEGITALIGGGLMVVFNSFPIWVGAFFSVLAAYLLKKEEIPHQKFCPRGKTG